MIFKTPKFWQNNNFISWCLSPFSLIYLLVHKINFNLQTPQKFNKTIICIGNITAGGAGKTPTAIVVGSLLQNLGYNIAFACKNYVGQNSQPKMIDYIHDIASDVSDEPLLLAKVAPTFAAKHRIEAIKLACANRDVDIVIVDDGLQSNRFVSDIKIMVIDNDLQFGNKKLLPAGPLREPISRSGEYDLILQVGGVKKNITEFQPYQNKLFILTKHLQTPKPIKKQYIAFSGIAYPEKFFKDLEQLKINVIEKISFPDHYLYKNSDLVKLQNLALKLQAQLITTEKDSVRMNTYWKKEVQTIKMTLSFVKQEDFISKLKNKLNNI